MFNQFFCKFILYTFQLIVFLPIAKADIESADRSTTSTIDVVTIQNQEHIFISPYVNVYHDRGKEWTLNEFIHISKTKRPLELDETRNIGFGLDEHYWGHFSIENKGQRNAYVLQFKEPLIDDLQIHFFRDGQVFKQEKLGRLYQTQRMEKNSRFYNIDLDVLPDDKIDVYFSISSSDSFAMNMDLHTPSSLRASEKFDTALLGIYYGIVACTLMFALLTLLIMRDIKFIYYTAAIICLHLLSLTVENGLIPSAIPIFNLWFQRDLYAWSMNVGFIFLIPFARDILCQGEHLIPYKKHVNKLQAFPALGITALLFIDYKYAVIVMILVASSMAGSILYLAGFALVRKNKESIYFILAWSAGLIGGLITTQKHWGMEPASPFINNTWQIGMAIEAILFSLVLVRHMLNHKKARLAAEQIALKNAFHAQQAERKAMKAEMEKKEVALKVEAEMNQKLEETVKERTSDLTLMLKKLEENNIRLSELSINDPLTKVRNRRFFDDQFVALWLEAQRHALPISLIMIDIDHFKNINDTYGHQVGDESLKSIAKILNDNMDYNGFVARYGGEEFITVLPSYDLKRATHVAEKIREVIENSVVMTKEHKIKVTASIGVASTIPEDSYSAKDLIDYCDKALYKAKELGRNQVQTWNKEIETNAIKSNEIEPYPIDNIYHINNRTL